MTYQLQLLPGIFLFFIIIGNAQDATNKTKFLQTKAENGFDFYALGNEPFWSLDMDYEKEFRFKNLDELNINVPAVEGVNAIDADVTRYRSDSDTYELVIQIDQQDCSDTMTDNIFYYKVTIDYKKKEDTDYTRLSGCGNFVPDYRLHNIWAIESIETKNLKEVEFMKGQPILEIDMVKNRISGHDGCNNIMGSVRSENGTLQFGMIAGTMMGCPNLEISNEISKTLSNKRLTYKYIDRKLYFIDQDKTVMTLYNID
jgi:uncharacterized membrane protein/heat shock protein HslJ